MNHCLCRSSHLWVLYKHQDRSHYITVMDGLGGQINDSLGLDLGAFKKYLSIWFSGCVSIFRHCDHNLLGSYI